jgi:hypothetical protein
MAHASLSLPPQGSHARAPSAAEIANTLAALTPRNLVSVAGQIQPLFPVRHQRLPAIPGTTARRRRPGCLGEPDASRPEAGGKIPEDEPGEAREMPEALPQNDGRAAPNSAPAGALAQAVKAGPRLEAAARVRAYSAFTARPKPPPAADTPQTSVPVEGRLGKWLEAGPDTIGSFSAVA